MGHHARSEALFHYLRLEDQIPENHLLRLIERHIQLRNGAAATQRQLQRNPVGPQSIPNCCCDHRFLLIRKTRPQTEVWPGKNMAIEVGVRWKFPQPQCDVCPCAKKEKSRL
jgi:hypothetical protein